MRIVLTRYDASRAGTFICRGIFLLNVAKELIQLCNIRIEQICISVYVPQKQFKSKTSISQQLLKEIHKRFLFIKLSLNSNGLETNELCVGSGILALKFL